MILKDVTVTTYHERLIVGERRISDKCETKQQLISELNKKNAGLKGEKSLNYYLSFLPKNNHIIVHNLRLQNDAGYFYQIDTLVFLKRYFVMIDAKHHTGKIIYDANFKQLIQEKNNSNEVMTEPLQQIERQLMQLQTQFNKQLKNSPKVFPYVVFTNPSVQLAITPEKATKPSNLIRLESLPSILKKLEMQIQHDLFTINELKQLAKYLIKKNVPYDAEVLSKFNVSRDHIITGVHCPKCLNMKMKRIPYKAVWLCAICHYTSKDAHINALRDYYLLLGPKITNKVARWFLEIESETIVKKILKATCKQKVGKGSATVYSLDNLQS